jgi:branched-chain amino acid transport system ATP-binding protein
MSAPTVNVENLVVRRGGKLVLHDVSFTVAPGTITTLLGANGAGKSSTVMAIAGALPIESGGVRLGDDRLNGLPADTIRRRGVALVPEGHRVLGQLSVEDNLRVACLDGSASARRRGLDKVYSIFPELSERRRQIAANLSGGQKQMVAMGQAFIAEPKVMIVDELSLGLAPAVVGRLAEALKVATKQGISVLLIEQFAKLALDLASRAVVIERGRLVFNGAAEALRQQPEILHGAYLAN